MKWRYSNLALQCQSCMYPYRQFNASLVIRLVTSVDKLKPSKSIKWRLDSNQGSKNFVSLWHYTDSVIPCRECLVWHTSVAMSHILSVFPTLSPERSLATMRRHLLFCCSHSRLLLSHLIIFITLIDERDLLHTGVVSVQVYGSSDAFTVAVSSITNQPVVVSMTSGLLTDF